MQFGKCGPKPHDLLTVQFAFGSIKSLNEVSVGGVEHVNIYTYIYIYIYICIAHIYRGKPICVYKYRYIHTYIYIYSIREKTERERHTYIYIYIYIYIYAYLFFWQVPFHDDDQWHSFMSPHLFRDGNNQLMDNLKPSSGNAVTNKLPTTQFHNMVYTVHHPGKLEEISRLTKQAKPVDGGRSKKEEGRPQVQMARVQRGPQHK